MPLTAKRPTQELVDLVGALGGTWTGYRQNALSQAGDLLDQMQHANGVNVLAAKVTAAFW